MILYKNKNNIVYLLLYNSVTINSQRIIKQFDPPLTIYF